VFIIISRVNWLSIYNYKLYIDNQLIRTIYHFINLLTAAILRTKLALYSLKQYKKKLKRDSENFKC